MSTIGTNPQPPAIPPNRPPKRPPTPPPPTKPPKSALQEIDNVLISALAMACTSLPASQDPVEICGQEILKFRLRMARRAVADLLAYQTPVRSPLDSAAAVAGGPAQTTRPASGECLAPGSGAALSGAVTESGGAVVAPIAGALLPAGRPPLPGGDFLLPRDVRVLT